MSTPPPPPPTPLQLAMTALARSLQAELAEPIRAGHPVLARVNHLPEEVELLETRNIDFDLTGTLNPFQVTRTEDPTTRVTKNIQFNSFTPENKELENLGPLIQSASPVYGGILGTSGVLEQLARLVTGTSVPQVLTTLKGKVGIPVPTKRRVAVQVAWAVLTRNDKGDLVDLPASEYVAPQGLSGPQVPVVFIPPVLASEPAADASITRFLRATLTLVAEGQKVVQPLPELELKIPPLVVLLGKLLVPRLVNSGAEPGMPNTALLEPPLSQLKNVTGAFDLAYDSAATGRSGLTLPVKVQWRLTEDEAGRTPLLQDKVPHRPEGLTGAAVSVVLGPRVQKFTSAGETLGGATLSQVWLHVSVQLAGKGPDGKDYPAVALPRIPLPVPTLRVPTLLAMFNHSEFSLGTHGGIPPCAVVVYPTSSAVGAGTPAAVIDVLTAFHAAVARLAGPFPTLPGLGLLSHAVGPLGRLVELVTALHAATTPGEEKGWKLLVRNTDREHDLEGIVFYREFLSKQSAEDSLGSMLFIGSPGDGARFYIDEDMESEDGAFTLRLPKGNDGAFAAVVHSLHGGRPRCTPDEAIRDVTDSEDGSFGDRLSSFEFLAPE